MGVHDIFGPSNTLRWSSSDSASKKQRVEKPGGGFIHRWPRAKEALVEKPALNGFIPGRAAIELARQLFLYRLLCLLRKWCG